MTISPFTPLFFSDSNNPSDGCLSNHLQVFAPTDQLLIEVIAEKDDDAPTASLHDACTGEVVSTISFSEWIMTSRTLYFATLQGLSDGVYYVTINDADSEPFKVTSDAAELERTTLVQYRFKDNKQRDDVVSIISGVTYFFDWRVYGGFKDSGWSFGVNNEQFSTQDADIVELYARDYTLKTFTLGGAQGVPVTAGQMLNRVLTCNYVYFNGKRFTRNESEVPSVNVLIEGLDSFVFTQTLREVHNLNATIESNNQAAILRKVTTDTARTTSAGDVRLIDS